MEELNEKKSDLKLPSGKPATLLNNMLNGYIYDPVYMKLEYITQQEARKHGSDTSTQKHNASYLFGPGGRADELKMDFLKDKLPDATYAFLLHHPIQEITIALKYRAISTYKERQQMD